MKHWSIAVLQLSLVAPLVACSSSDGASSGGAGASGNGAAGAHAAGGSSNGVSGSNGASGASGAHSGGSAGLGGSALGSGGSTAGSAGVSVGGAGVTAGSAGSSAGGGSATAGNGGSTSSNPGAGAGGSAGVTGGAGAGTAGGAGSTALSVLQYHNTAARDGVYVDAKLTQTAAATLHIDTTFTTPTISGRIYAQPLYLAGAAGKPDAVIVATEANQVYAFNASSGAQLWNKSFGTAVSTGLPCGNIASGGNTLGITGTPVIDSTTRTLYFDAMTADATVTAKHLVHAVDADTGAERTGWPVDMNAKAKSGATTFDSLVQNQRAALTLLGGKLIVPFGGHVGDCQGYHGWLVGISTADATQVSAWATRAIAGGVWGVAGPASDGTSVFFATGNSKATATDGPTSSPATWGDGETVYKFGSALTLPADSATTDFFVPSNWAALDRADQDVGGTAPVLFDVSGATPSKLAIALGKDGNAYLLNRENLGGRDATALSTLKVTTGVIINAAVAYTTATATYVVFKNSAKASGCPTGQSGGLSALKIAKASPPSLSVAWCGGPATNGSPAMSMTSSAGANPVVWVVGSDNKLYGVDGDTGQSVFAGGATALPAVQSIQTPIIVNGRVFVASNSAVTAYTTN